MSDCERLNLKDGVKRLAYGLLVKARYGRAHL